MGIRARSAWLPAVSAAATCTAHFTSHCLLRWPHRRLMSAAACNAHCRFANAWTRLGLTQSLAELPAGLLDSPELVSSSSYAASGSLPSSTSASGGGGSALDTTAYAPGSQVRGRRGFMSAVVAAAQASLQQLCWQRTSHQRVQAGCYAAFCRRPRPSLPTPEAPKCSPRLHSAHCTPATPATPAPSLPHHFLCRKCGWRGRCCGGTMRMERRWCPPCSTLSSLKPNWRTCGSR